MSQSQPVLVVELRGRLGNHLFQFATGLALAQRVGAELRFDELYSKDEDRLLRVLLRDRYRVATKQELLRVGVLRPSGPAEPLLRNGARIIAKSARRMRRLPGPWFGDLYPSSKYHPELFDLVAPAYLRGYHQTEKYFADIASQVVEALQWPTHTPLMQERPTVAVSFRRGDYNDIGAVLPWTYYEQALEMMRSTLGAMDIVVFGDDQLFVEFSVPHLERYGNVVVSTAVAEGPLAQLELMTACDHVVMSNSSFAWWGAWLGDQRTQHSARMVICPAEYARHDRVPERWRKIATGLRTSF